VKHVDIYADGACSGNPGPGGYGAILIYKGARRELSAGCASTTNNREELKGIIAALEALKEPCVVTVYSDSAYIVNAFHRNWLNAWIARGWRNSKNQPVLNRDLWERLVALSGRPGFAGRHRVGWARVRGHAGNPLNERCDELARAATARAAAESTGSTYARATRR
jgi:ribonuclease HI